MSLAGRWLSSLVVAVVFLFFFIIFMAYFIVDVWISSSEIPIKMASCQFIHEMLIILNDALRCVCLCLYVRVTCWINAVNLCVCKYRVTLASPHCFWELLLLSSSLFFLLCVVFLLWVLSHFEEKKSALFAHSWHFVAYEPVQVCVNKYL